MTIDSVKSATATYQGSVPVAATNKKSDPQVSSKPVKKEAQVETPKKQIISSEDNTEVPQITKQDADAIKKIIAQMNTLSNSTAEFEFHEKTHRTIIRIVDKETKEVIKEFPPAKMLDVLAKTWEMLGLMVDEKR